MRKAPRGYPPVSGSSSSMYSNPGKEPPRMRSPPPGQLIDPNEFIEELSDNEDWDSMAQLVQTMPPKRKSEVPLDRPQKRPLLGVPPPPRPTSADPWQDPAAVKAKPLFPKAYPSVSYVPPVEKSFFRMELPSVPPRIYFTHKQGELEREPEAPPRDGPPQSRIAPAVALDQGDTSWRYSQRPPRRFSPGPRPGGYF
ncbi:unnamed protein product [Cylicostephanus goldi]|uniref:Uncharacterized protein n=1 Tax=Cylicostephanus goldi TaxID=71465 RepID=A0A3P6RTY7_CYLGO|nr:unnamed protein product [Cylicostephanus goldi]